MKKTTKVLASILCASQVLMFAPSVSANGDADNIFSDLSGNEWYYESSMFAYEKGIMTGVSDTKFAPMDTTTRAMIAVVIHRLEGEPQVTSTTDLTDISSNAWYSDAVNWCTSNGIIEGYEDDTFAPLKTITREELAVILQRYVHYKEVVYSDNEHTYADEMSVSSWAKSAVSTLNSLEVMSGDANNNFNGKNGLTRAELSKVLQNLSKHIEFAEITPEEVVKDTDNYVTLDGDWNFKMYRTYDQMFQYLPANKCNVVWTDDELAKLPTSETFSSWETIELPTEGDNGGLMPSVREDGSDYFRKWSEAWVSREFTLPEDFTDEENVTLLLGIIDDADVVYINGHLVAGSGFTNSEKTPTVNSLEIGGFNYNYEDPTDTSQVLFEKSYWEISREYEIPTNVLNLGGTNEISIRVYNNNGNGGFYSGHTYAIAGDYLSAREVQGLPTEDGKTDEFMSTINSQISALESKDFAKYGDTILEDYNNDGLSKSEYIKGLEELLSGYSDIEVADSSAGYWLDDDGNRIYEATRVITGISDETGEKATISTMELSQYFVLENGKMSEIGNMSNCYSLTYASELFAQDLVYSVYLPPSYHENTTKEYPVVYLLHGINSSSNSFIEVDKIEEFMNNEIASGNITEMIIVMPDSGKNSFYKDTTLEEGKFDSTGPWESHITQEIKSQVENRFRVLEGPEFTGLTGISMGGGGAMRLGTLNPDLYSSVASHMGALNDETMAALETLTAEQLENYDFYIDCGLQDNMVKYEETVRTHEYLESVGVEHGYSLRDGEHNSAFYMAGMPASMKMHSDHFIENLK